MGKVINSLYYKSFWAIYGTYDGNNYACSGWSAWWIPCGSIHISMMTSSNGNIFRVTRHLCGEFTGHRWIPRTKASDAQFDIFFDLRLNEWLSKQRWGWWFETQSRPLWRHFNGCIFRVTYLSYDIHLQDGMIRCHLIQCPCDLYSLDIPSWTLTAREWFIPESVFYLQLDPLLNIYLYKNIYIHSQLLCIDIELYAYIGNCLDTLYGSNK